MQKAVDRWIKGICAPSLGVSGGRFPASGDTTPPAGPTGHLIPDLCLDEAELPTKTCTAWEFGRYADVPLARNGVLEIAGTIELTGQSPLGLLRLSEDVLLKPQITDILNGDGLLELRSAHYHRAGSFSYE
jgi:hypothetical protein